MELSEKQALRFRFLHALYEATKGRTTAHVNEREVSQSLAPDGDQIRDAVEYLQNEGLLKRVAFGGTIAITHAGVQEVERALSEPEDPTEHFPAGVVNITNIGTMMGSQLQQGTQGSTQKQYTAAINVGELQAFIESFRRLLPELQLDHIQRREAEADLATLDAQASSGKPKTGIVRESLASLRHIIEHALGHAAGAGLLANNDHLLAAVGAK
jgi:hypothetical protein